MTLLMPLLSEADPITSSEGALDPLGFYTIADALAVRLVPGVRERQTRPRWLTVIAAGLVVCSDFEADRVAKDEISEPWQVYEWHMVEGLARTMAENEETLRMPGLLKARAAIRDGVPLSSSRYLKTPSVFGLHGVYRLLARSLEIESNGRLGDFGVELIQVWSREQGLDGFHQAAAGEGYALRRQLQEAVEDGLRAGAVARRGGWAGWNAIRQHFAPGKTGTEEAKALTGALIDRTAGYRGEILRALTGPDGREEWRSVAESDDSGLAERRFHEWLRHRATPDLRRLLDAILAYEAWARALQDAFDACLYGMTVRGGRTSCRELAEMPAVRHCCGRVEELFPGAADYLAEFDRESAEFQKRFAGLSHCTSAEKWVEDLLEHHRNIQRNKPPAGKNPFFERFDDGSYVIRSAYRRLDPVVITDQYVHGYRTWPLWTFSIDLRLVS